MLQSLLSKDIFMAKVVDMTVGSPFKKITVFAIPIALSFLLQNVYSFCDTLIVSLSRGSQAMTAINLTGSFSFFVNCSIQGMSTGFGIKLSQFIGAKDEDKMRNSVAVSIVLSFIIGTVFSLLFFFIAKPVLVLMKTGDAYLDASVSYIRAIFIGGLFMMLYNLSDQILRAMGDSKTPVITLIICALLNILLNCLLFITDLGVSWAGYATIISQAISAIIGFTIIFTRFKVLRLNRKDFSFNKDFVMSHLKMGFPLSLQFSITALGCMFSQKAFNALGNSYYSTAQTTASRIDNFFGSILNGLGVAMATYVGQNYGAKDYKRIREGANIAWLIGLIFTAVATVGVLSTCIPLSKLLIKDEYAVDEVFSLILKYILIQDSLYYFLFMIHAYRSSVQAIGFGKITVIGGIIEFVSRVLIVETLAKIWGFVGAILCNPLAWITAGIFFAISFYVCLKKLENSAKNDNNDYNLIDKSL